jgi:hypothetical protein
MDGRWVQIDTVLEAMDGDDWADAERDRHIIGEEQIVMERESRQVPQSGDRD